MADDAGAGEKLKVFISYSHRDSATFADELVAGLELADFAPFLDRHDIAAGEDWETRLGGLIQQSDTVVFVVSPEAVKSQRCVWEVDKTLALSKRLLPVIFKPVAEDDIPEKLSRLQFVRFDTGRGITRPLTELAEALRQDLEWIREHTRLGDIATRWERRGRQEALLLRGDDLDAAKAWMAARKAAAPEITDAQRAFIRASEEAENTRLGKERAQLEVIRRGQETTARQQRRIAWLLGGLAALVAGSILGLIAWINQSFIKQQLNLYWNVSPYRTANFKPRMLSPEVERALKPLEPFRECIKDCPAMIVIPAGSFTMGSPESEMGRLPREGPQHDVKIAKRFAVSRFEVTWDDWDACVNYGDCANNISDSIWGHGARPVINVTWEEAKQYVAWLSGMTGQTYRLLTEAEWEYAARAGTSTAYPWGDEIGNGNANCNGCGSKWADDEKTAPVGQFPANAFGLHDMNGNVWEWVEDCYQSNYNGAPTDGLAFIFPDCPNRVVRGGSWSWWQNSTQSARSASRDNYATKNTRRSFVGFRVARTLTP
jgi:formylglycine-generating enzyme required for sulfatase activity